MTTISLTGETFESEVLKDGIVLVDFWAAWCGPCRMFGPIFEDASEKYSEITFAKVDTGAEQELSASAGISSIPTLMAFRDGVLVFRQPGALPAASLESLIGSIAELDMEQVRSTIKEEAGN
jgi:thioredoxin 1